MYCSSCGGQLSGVESFCSMCGETTLSGTSLKEGQGSGFETSPVSHNDYPERVNPWATFFTSQADFKGRANRAEYWVGAAYIVAWTFVSFLILGIFTAISDVLSGLFALILLASFLYLLYLTLVLYIRRFHDMSMSGLWILLYLVPFAGWIVFFVLGIKGSDPENQYGAPRIS